MTPETTISATDPRSGERLDAHPATPPSAIPELTAAAAAACSDARLHDTDRRAAALRGAAARLRADGERLRDRFQRESGLPAARAAGELERTCVQLEALADVVADGAHLEPIIDRADPDAAPAPRPDLRRMLVPVGPVAVFGASNFPFAFGVAGGDTAAALAVGCPVVAKGHPAQPGLNRAVADHVAAAIEEAQLPAAAFALVQGDTPEIGAALVRAQEIAAVAFTGSTKGGRALFDLAAARERPIPVFAEMGSVNPAVVTAGALRRRGAEIAQTFVASITGAAGQLCTKPGVVLVPEGEEGDRWCADVAERLAAAQPLVMLTARMRDALVDQLADLAARDDVRPLTPSSARQEPGFRIDAATYETSATALATAPALREECFGPFALLARYASQDELLTAVRAFDGQLATALHADVAAEPELAQQLSAALERRCGRVVFDGWPTGVAVTWAMQHGGPYPATTAPGETSVGMTATRRFQRPVCWQDAPQELLPQALRDANPRGTWRRVDGQLTNASIGA
ncbi:aldehyde dehydrogenase (NADP(+)) [Conexibacter sp. CPCC 206217]|uniref:aldehyde dehydrogenase (NADP(+)) n=1 Tax=Conexibacter sp. CPCC 206217 TaxID=3064574 RepID=UPI0027248654|nr:aldehyde dehydrogenase (NADP(+)) [Conexibacter sp. CPCC 206217]MDO8210235.1 aldehyde dehydrogenase (NADP(+)) [Conexibacter sp. CPCC 206217]